MYIQPLKEQTLIMTNLLTTNLDFSANPTKLFMV